MSDMREMVWRLGAENADGFADDISKADKSVDDLKNHIQDSDKVTSGTFGRMRDSLKNTGAKFKSVGGGMMKAGAAMTAATLPLTVKLKQGVSDARDLDTAIRQVTTLTDENILPTEELKKTTKRISNESGIMQQEVANAMYQALSSGIKNEDVTAFTEQGLKLAKAGFTDLPTVIDATTTALNAYGDKAFDVSKIQDIMVKTQDLGKITVDEMGKSLGRVIPTAAAAGVNMDQLGAGYAMLTAKGMNAELATTTLNSMIAELGNNGSKSDKALRSMTGKSFRELTAEGKNMGEILQIVQDKADSAGLQLSDMFGNINAGKAANSLLGGGAKEFGSILDKMQNSDGSVDKNFEKMMGDELKHAQAVEQLRNAFIDMGTAITPVLTNIMQGIGNLATKFSELSPESQKMISIFALIVVGAGPLIGMLGALVFGIGALATGFAAVTAPMLLMVGGIAILIAAGVALYTHWDVVKAKAVEVGGSIKSGLKGAADAVIGGFNTMKSTVNSALESIKQKWESVKQFFKHPIKGVVSIAGSVADKVKTALPSHASGLDAVPYDNYQANLHKDEMILTAAASKEYRAMGGTKDSMPSLISNSTASVTKTNNNSVSTINPNFTINYYGTSEKQEDAVNIAGEVRKELDIFFRELQYQGG